MITVAGPKVLETEVTTKEECKETSDTEEKAAADQMEVMEQINADNISIVEEMGNGNKTEHLIEEKLVTEEIPQNDNVPDVGKSDQKVKIEEQDCVTECETVNETTETQSMDNGPVDQIKVAEQNNAEVIEQSIDHVKEEPMANGLDNGKDPVEESVVTVTIVDTKEEKLLDLKLTLQNGEIDLTCGENTQLENADGCTIEETNCSENTVIASALARTPRSLIKPVPIHHQLSHKISRTPTKIDFKDIQSNSLTTNLNLGGNNVKFEISSHMKIKTCLLYTSDAADE